MESNQCAATFRAFMDEPDTHFVICTLTSSILLCRLCIYIGSFIYWMFSLYHIPTLSWVNFRIQKYILIFQLFSPYNNRTQLGIFSKGLELITMPGIIVIATQKIMFNSRSHEKDLPSSLHKIINMSSKLFYHWKIHI